MQQVQMEDHLLSRFRVLQRLLWCPSTRTELSLVSLPDLLSRLPGEERARVPAGTIGAFVSGPTAMAYPILGRVVSFLEQDALRLANTETTGTPPVDPQADTIKRSVKNWYDEFGWKRNEKGLYNDTALFSQGKPAGHGLYEMASHLSLIDRLGGGEFVLDAASGALAHPEYLAYSWYYRYRVCVDMSLTALQEAEAKIGDGGYCCLADICRLPFRDNTFDGVVSGYTIQHIPESQQVQALKELFRVLRPSASLCVITGVRRTRWHRAIVFGCRATKKLLKILRVLREARTTDLSERSITSVPPHQLYFASHDWKWWRNVGQELTDQGSVECMRLFTQLEYRLIFGQSTRAAKFAHALETCLPRLLARASAYCLIDLRKRPGRGKKVDVN